MKITEKTKLCDVLHEAAKNATGCGTLYANGDRCLWGEAAHMCGLEDHQMAGSSLFGSLEEGLDGMHEWDCGQKTEAVAAACGDDEVGETVADFRNYLLDLEYTLRDLEVVGS